MKRLIRTLLLAAALIIAAACEFRPLVELSNTHYVRVYLDDAMMNVNYGFYNEDYAKPSYSAPQVLRIVLTDPQTGLIKADRYLRDTGEDEHGRYYEGYVIAAPGEYDIFAYNFDTEANRLYNTNDYNKALVATGEIPPHLRSQLASRAEAPEDEKIVYDADYTFVAKEKGVTIPYSDKIDTLRTRSGDFFEAESIVKSYYLQVRVKGLRHLTSAVSLLGGMSGSRYLTAPQAEDDKVTLYFRMGSGESAAAGVALLNAETASESEEYVIYTTFGTFGKLPDENNRLEITFDFMTVYGKPFTASFDITDLFYTKDAIEHQWLLIDETIVIPDPPEVGGGGFIPGVDEWGDVNTDIII